MPRLTKQGGKREVCTDSCGIGINGIKVPSDHPPKKELEKSTSVSFSQ